MGRTTDIRGKLDGSDTVVTGYNVYTARDNQFAYQNPVALDTALMALTTTQKFSPDAVVVRVTYEKLGNNAEEVLQMIEDDIA